MVAGFPPYQAQSTQKLEELIRSKRPPRALPETCPAGLRAIIRKALAGEMQNRYGSAAAFEQDLRLFLANRLTQAETEKQHAWEANPTGEKTRGPSGMPSQTAREIVGALRSGSEPGGGEA